MLADAIESVKRRCFGGSAPPRSGADGVDAGRPESEPTDDLPPFALTPTEEVVHLLRDRGGRASQGEIVEALELSPATVSRRLGEMEAAGRIVRYPVGRRKIVCLPDSRPAAVRSPYEA